jgi:hypothetical protein
VLAASVAGMLLQVRSPLLRYALPVLLVGAVVFGVGLGRARAPLFGTTIAPIFSFADHGGDDVAAARWVEQHVDEGAVFVVPPGFGVFRLVARRAVVVDWKAIPFEEPAMRSWRERMTFCYGPTAATGFDAEREMEERYRVMSDAKLDAIRERYGATLALLHAETPTARRVLYANDGYRVVEL